MEFNILTVTYLAYCIIEMRMVKMIVPYRFVGICDVVKTFKGSGATPKHSTVLQTMISKCSIDICGKNVY